VRAREHRLGAYPGAFDSPSPLLDTRSTARWEIIPEFTYRSVMIVRLVPGDCGHGRPEGSPVASPHGWVFHGWRPIKRVDVAAVLDGQHRYTPPIRQRRIPGYAQVLILWETPGENLSC
jgi:hypothetical protein